MYLQWNLSIKETLSTISLLRTPDYCLNHTELCIHILPWIYGHLSILDS